MTHIHGAITKPFASTTIGCGSLNIPNSSSLTEFLVGGNEVEGFCEGVRGDQRENQGGGDPKGPVQIGFIGLLCRVEYKTRCLYES